MDRHELKRRVIELARDQLYMLGVGRLRIDSLCAGLGISKRTFYEMFGTKDRLVECCFALTLKEHRRMVAEIGEGESTSYKQLCDLLDLYVSFVYKLEPVLYKDVYIRQSYLKIIEDLKEFWLETIEKAFDDCRNFTLKGTDSAFNSRFLIESVNKCRLHNLPIGKTEDMLFRIVRGSVKKEFLYE